MNRTDRLYALVEELRAAAPRPRSARQLAGRYEVSTRTIERDILALQESGVPIYAEPGRTGGYVIDKTQTLPPLNFTAAEMVALAVSLAGAEQTPFAAALRSTLRKVLASASAARTAEAAQLMDRVRLVATTRPGRSGPPPDAAPPDAALPDAAPPDAALPGAAPPDAAGRGRRTAGAAGPGTAGAVPSAARAAARPGPGRTRPETGPERPAVPLAIQEAITARHILVLDYRDRRDVVTVREVEPVAFVGIRAQWYLLTWCRLRDSARAFRLDRIVAVTDTGEPAPHRSYRDLDVDIPDAVVCRPELVA